MKCLLLTALLLLCASCTRDHLYYASSDTRMHVATSTVDRLVDYCLNTEPDGLRTGETVRRLNDLIDRNSALQ